MIIYASTTQASTPQLHNVTFDTDSFPILVDNCATVSISNNNLDDFEGPVTPVRGQVQGISGYTGVGRMKGAIKWDIENDTGQTQNVQLPGS
jgi:hypothetical protein